jgi:hypothetical protein
VTLHCARPDAHELGGLLDRSASRDVGGEDVDLLQPPDPQLSPDGSSLVIVCAVGGGFDALLLAP